MRAHIVSSFVLIISARYVYKSVERVGFRFPYSVKNLIFFCENLRSVNLFVNFFDKTSKTSEFQSNFKVYPPWCMYKSRKKKKIWIRQTTYLRWYFTWHCLVFIPSQFYTYTHRHTEILSCEKLHFKTWNWIIHMWPFLPYWNSVMDSFALTSKAHVTFSHQREHALHFEYTMKIWYTKLIFVIS
jgi:hypothetical protein